MDAPLAEVGGNAHAERLRHAGLRVTLPRVNVLKTMERMHGHRSVDEVVAALHEDGVTLGRASVYNVINDFVRTGLVMVADVGPGRALYELANEWHAHFVCTDCGRVFDVDTHHLPNPEALRAACGYGATEVQVNFKGPCPEGAACPHTAEDATAHNHHAPNGATD